MNSHHITTYSEARQASFRRLVLSRHLECLRQEAESLERKIGSLLHFGLQVEADLLEVDLHHVHELITRYQTGIDAGADLVATIAPRMLAWAS
jgi:hypothetical protein